ncbi:N-acetylmuramoyl-L-alanine amidase [Paenibacillus sp. 481]|nr:N-acetylmuramoyl-L-alanine amidase [Paenibacillus sp. 481]
MTIDIKQRLLPNGRPNKPNRSMKPLYVTLHNTDNEAPGATAEAHSRYIIHGSGGAKKSWHYTVDDRDVYQHLRDDEQGWHAGDGSGPGNALSIGVEICMYNGMNEQAAWRNAAALVAELMLRHNIPLHNIVPHRHWSGKGCPSRLLPHWSTFLQTIDRLYASGKVKLEATKKAANDLLNRMNQHHPKSHHQPSKKQANQHLFSQNESSQRQPSENPLSQNHHNNENSPNKQDSSNPLPPNRNRNSSSSSNSIDLTNYNHNHHRNRNHPSTTLQSPKTELEIVTITLPDQSSLQGILINGKVYAPVRELGESFGHAVQWNSVQRSVLVSSKK